ncbi:MAG: DMT family transporter [Chloroflexi bacterium]|nr:DMT family transporter [Chloroflexota bacterium]
MKNSAAPNIIILGTLFGTTLVASRFSVGQMAPLTYVSLRLSLAGLAFLIIYTFSIGGRKWPKDRTLWRRGIILGIFGTALPMISFTSSLQYLSSGLVSVLMTTSPAFTVVMAHFLLPDEKLSWHKSIGIALALIGGLLLTIRGESGLATSGEGNLIGYALVFAGIISASSMGIYVRKKMRNYRSSDVAVVRMSAASLAIFPFTWLVAGYDMSQVNTSGWLVLLYAAIAGTFFAMLLDFSNTARFGPTVAAMVTYVIPVVAVISGALLLDEKITLTMLFGMIFVVIGIGFILQTQNTPTVKPASYP